MIRTARSWLMLLLVIATTQAHAAARAWLQPDRIGLGQTTTLNVEADGAFADAPDFSVLEPNFVLRGQSSSNQTTIINGRSATRTLYAVELEPREAGLIGIPALRVGSDQTAPISLTVLPGMPGLAERGDTIFLETELGTHAPYVQQAVPYTVRLYYAIPLLNGGIDVRPPDDASLQKLGEDRNYQQDIGGRRYQVFERSYLLVPEKSGALVLPPPQFRGRARTNDINTFFDGGGSVSAVGKHETLQVRPQPSNAPAPWLPASSVLLARSEPPGSARAGEPLMLELTLTADDATVAQLPELVLPAMDDAQVFPEPPQTKDDIVDGRPRATLTRRFAIVPMRQGALRIPEMRVGFWDTVLDRAAAATLPAVTLTIAPGTAQPLAPATPAATAPSSARAVADTSSDQIAATRFWQRVAAAIAAALVVTLWWGWRRGRALASHAAGAAVRNTPIAPASPGGLRRALTDGDLRAIADALRASTTPSSASLGGVGAKLADPVQRATVEQLERALWAPNVDAATCAAARARLREVFRNGPRFADAAVSSANDPLPPLYPTR